MVRWSLMLFLLLGIPLISEAQRPPETPDTIAKEILAPLLDPLKVATLKGERPINTRLYKVLYCVGRELWV